jgi:type I restriction enzyme S subunit
MNDQVRKGYKLTEVGVIPEDWTLRSLREMLQISSGFSFKSEFFSTTGTIVLTPGNFKLEGGLYFTDRNTKRYSVCYPESTVFQKGDLLVVMTDLTPDCNLLGKPAFVETEEKILHNQRIGKLNLITKNLDKNFLYFLLLSPSYLRKIKEQATGSTVRHTSNNSIYSVVLPIPSRVEEQTAIATVLSDSDRLIESLDRLIAKKRNLKQATMQQLLTGKTRLSGFSGEWEVKRLGDVANIQRGASPRPINSTIWFDRNSSVGWVRISDVSSSDMRLYETEQKLSILGIQNSRPVAKGNLIMSICATVGRPIITEIDTCIHDGFVVFDNLKVDKIFMYYILKWIEPNWSKHGQTGSQMNLNTTLINKTTVAIPPLPEQTAIASILSDMDSEIAALEQQRDKTRALKQGMMQELLTGRIRLI